jgi:hypothetical protein
MTEEVYGITKVFFYVSQQVEPKTRLIAFRNRILTIPILKTTRKKITSFNVFSFTKRNSAPCEQLVVMCDAYLPAQGNHI